MRNPRPQTLKQYYDELEHIRLQVEITNKYRKRLVQNAQSEQLRVGLEKTNGMIEVLTTLVNRPQETNVIKKCITCLNRISAVYGVVNEKLVDQSYKALTSGDSVLEEKDHDASASQKLLDSLNSSLRDIEEIIDRSNDDSIIRENKKILFTELKCSLGIILLTFVIIPILLIYVPPLLTLVPFLPAMFALQWLSLSVGIAACTAAFTTHSIYCDYNNGYGHSRFFKAGMKTSVNQQRESAPQLLQSIYSFDRAE